MSSVSRRRFWKSSSVRLTLVASGLIWLANATVVLLLYNVMLQSLVGEVSSRVDRDVEQQLARWPRELPHQTGISQWLYRHLALQIADLEHCATLIDAEGEVQISNIDAAGPDTPLAWRGYRTVRHAGHRWAPERFPENQVCLAGEYRLPDGGTLLYGRTFDSGHATWQILQRLRFWGLLGTALLSLALGGLIALRALHGLQLINRVCARVARGDLSQRLPVRGSGNDLDHLAGAINGMLDQIEQLMDGIRQVSDAIAHDLKTPLARLRGQLELLLSLEDRSDAAILAVIAEADQVLAAFNALLRIAQLEQGSPRQAFIRFDFRRVLDSLRDIYELVFIDKSIDFSIEVGEGDHTAFGDRELWLQALTNLLDNAYKYTPSGGRVRLSLERDQGELLLTLQDSGPGIPEHEQDNVFKRFYRLESHRGQRGTGLGLALVAAVCKVHNATIELASRNGLIVRIRLPGQGE